MVDKVFKPKLSKEEAHVLCNNYDVDGDFWFEVAGLKILRGDCSRANFDAIFGWKTRNRGKSRPRKNKDPDIERALKRAIECISCPRRSIEALTELHGVGIPVASAIMAAIFPADFTIIDFRALETLSVPNFSTSSVPKYLFYRDYCKKLSSDWKMSLRELDRALWRWSELYGRSCLTPVVRYSE